MVGSGDWTFLHVQDNYWGGAVKTAQLWYKLTVDALKLGDWKEAAYSAGVLSHYVSDPFMPFHTGQTEAEGKVHRACEWSIAQSYVELRNILRQMKTYSACVCGCRCSMACHIVNL